jgi:hypothetical protein
MNTYENITKSLKLQFFRNFGLLLPISTTLFDAPLLVEEFSVIIAYCIVKRETVSIIVTKFLNLYSLDCIDQEYWEKDQKNELTIVKIRYTHILIIYIFILHTAVCI